MRNCNNTVLANIVWFAAMLATAVGVAAAAAPVSIRVIAGAESHGMIDACDCPVDPGGGLPKRASLLSSLGSPENRLLLDAGGFSAGGIYDDYSEGRAADSLRTSRMIAAMGVLGYDAVAVGDDDLQYGGAFLVSQARQAGVPLVCANCFIDKNKRLFEPYRVVVKQGIRIGITAVTTRERLFAIDPLVTIADPAASLKEIWKELTAKSDLQIVLSHLGQEETDALVRKFPAIALAVNGHRKTGKTPMVTMGTTPCLQFGFQGKSLAGALLTLNGKQRQVEYAVWYDVTPELPDDKDMVKFLKEPIPPAPAENYYDLYIMSQCPYGIEALNEFLTFTEEDPSVRWTLWFIGTVDDDTVFSSLHGSAEVLDEKMWLAVKSVYPSQWLNFLKQRVAGGSKPTRELLTGMQLDTNAIGKYVSKQGAAALQEHYFRSQRLAINSSPTLLVNNRPFGRNITAANLRRFHCLSMPEPRRGCDSLPECSEDADCRAPRKLGACMSGRCEFRDAVPFEFTVLIADSTSDHPEQKIIATTGELFPGADVRIVKLHSERGRQLVAKYGPAALPFYMFGPEVKLTHNFSSVSGGIVDRKGALTFRDGIVSVNYRLDRKKIPGSVALYVDPFFSEVPALLGMVYADVRFAGKVAIEPVFFEDPVATQPGTEERFRQEEALRWITLRSMSKGSIDGYLAAYAHRPGGSNWPALLAKTGLTADSLLAATDASAGLLTKQWKNIRALDVRGPVTLLLDNVETVTVSGERELRRILSTRIR